MLLRKANMAGEQRVQVRALMADGRLRTANSVAFALGIGPKMARDRLSEIGAVAERVNSRRTFWFLDEPNGDAEDQRGGEMQERLLRGGDCGL